MLRLRVGDLVQVAPGCGLESNKVGRIIPPGKVPMKSTGGGMIPNIGQGHYRPVDWKKEVAIRLTEDGIITMFKVCLKKI